MNWLPTDTATLHQIIAAQAAAGEAREAELAAAKAGLLVREAFLAVPRLT